MIASKQPNPWKINLGNCFVQEYDSEEINDPAILEISCCVHLLQDQLLSKLVKTSFCSSDRKIDKKYWESCHLFQKRNGYSTIYSTLRSF